MRDGREDSVEKAMHGGTLVSASRVAACDDDANADCRFCKQGDSEWSRMVI